MQDAVHTERERASPTKRAGIAVALTTLAALVVMAGTVAAPLLEQGGSAAGPWLRSLYASACHQIPERSLAVGGSVQAVCARCAGLYVGGLIGVISGGVLAALRRRIRPVWLVWAFAPSIVDFALGLLGLTSLPNVPRLVLALPAGVVVGAYLAIAVRDLAARRRGVSRPPATPLPVHPRDV